MHQLGHGRTPQRQRSRQQLKEGDTQRIKIRTPVDLLSGQLLRGHEAGGPQNEPRAGFARIRDARNAEVRHLHRVGAAVKHDVGRLDIAVHHVVGMGIVQRIGYPGRNGEYGGDWQQPVLAASMGQILAFKELHGDVGQVMLLAGIKNGDDVRMLQSPRSFGFAEKPRARINQGIAFKFLSQGQRLDGHDAADLGITPQIHHPHGTFANFAVNLVAPQHGHAHARVTGQAGCSGGGAWQRVCSA